MPRSVNRTLTSKELETLRLLAVEGVSVVEIAKRFNLSGATIRRRLYNAERKFNGKSLYNTVYLATQLGILK